MWKICRVGDWKNWYLSLFIIEPSTVLYDKSWLCLEQSENAHETNLAHFQKRPKDKARDGVSTLNSAYNGVHLHQLFTYDARHRASLI